jgi:probable phosphoglycerate mutase
MTTTHTTLFLARHGETEWHAENRYAGISDVSLNDRGTQQAARLGSWATGAGLDAVWASPLRRARATAAPAAAALGLPITVDAGLAEVGFGIAEGHTLAELPADRVAAFRADPVANAFPGADDPRVAAGRGARTLRRIAAQHPGDRVLVVTHSTLLRLVLCELVGIPLSGYRRVFPQVGNCATTELRLNHADTALIAYNTPLPSAGE